MKRLFLLLFLLLPGWAAFSQTITPEELGWITGPLWKGEFTKMDDKGDPQTTVPVELLVTKTNSGRFEFVYVFRDENNRTITNTITLNKTNNRLNKFPVTGREELSPGRLKITTAGVGKELGTKYQINYVFFISKNAFEIHKEVKDLNTFANFSKSRYRFSR